VRRTLLVTAFYVNSVPRFCYIQSVCFSVDHVQHDGQSESNFSEI